MKQSIDTGNKLLLQNGVHQGEVSEYTFDQTSATVCVEIEFLNPVIRLPYSIDLADKQGREQLGIVAGRGTVNDLEELMGSTGWYKVELLMVKTARGPVGVNSIVEALPKKGVFGR